MMLACPNRKPPNPVNEKGWREKKGEKSNLNFVFARFTPLYQSATLIE